MSNLVNHTSDRWRIAVGDGMMEALQPQRFNDPALSMRPSNTTLGQGNLDLCNYRTFVMPFKEYSRVCTGAGLGRLNGDGSAPTTG